ncbi:type II secretion system minor pseudopilin GspI [Halomonas denitrificans]|nr:type II secretion system minor pseudopilin GspI [Halomonas denitrificans]
MRTPRGFTLIEVLVALAVVALALGALARAAGNAAAVQYEAERRTFALWVASNRLAELELAPVAAGRSNGATRLGGIDWRWQVDIAPAPGGELWRVDVSVSDRSGSVATVQTGFLPR